MRETPCKMGAAFSELAERVIQRYIPGLLTIDSLADQLMQAGQHDGSLNEEPNWRALETLALGLCSKALCEGCLSPEVTVRELAFENLRRYLAETLGYSSAAAGLRASGQDVEVLQQTLLEIWSIFHLHGAGPEQPVTFLKWAQVILFRQLSQHLNQFRHTTWLSLETLPEAVLETLVAWNDVDPLDAVLQEEASEELKEAIMNLKNPQYRQVLLNTFFADLEERELAERWQVRVQDIYVWRCRALKALRKREVLTNIPKREKKRRFRLDVCREM